jgi:hypothetical protein
MITNITVSPFYAEEFLYIGFTFFLDQTTLEGDEQVEYANDHLELHDQELKQMLSAFV